MTPEQEQTLMQALYDRLFDAITYVPKGGGVNPFTKSETFIHFTKNEALQPSAFANAWNPTRVGGDLGASEMFAKMVDKVSPLSLEWAPKDEPLHKAYKSIVEGMNEAKSARPSQESIDAYEQAKAYLVAPGEINPFTKKVVPDGGPSQEFKDYQKNLTTLTQAYTDYQSAYNLYVDEVVAAGEDLVKKSKAQRDWNVTEKSLRREISNAQDTLTQGNSKWVQMALDTMNTTINDAISRAIESAKKSVADDAMNAGANGENWLLTYANPPNWYDEADTSNFSELSISSDNKVDDSTTVTHGYDFKTSFGGGLWSVSGNSAGNFSEKNRHMNSEKVSIKCKIAKVTIMRPWFDETLFRADNWWTNLGTEDAKNYVSDGTLNSTNADKILPMYPVAFIVARDIEITADFTTEDEKNIEQSASVGGSVGYGPFSVGGNYKYGNKSDHLDTKISNGTLKVPGMQIIGWVSRVTPASPIRSKKDMEPS